MTSTVNRKKRAIESDQSRYENAILNDDTDTFIELMKQGNVTIASVQAVKNASESKKNFYLRQILDVIKPEEFRLIATHAKQPDTSSSSTVATTSAKKAKTSAKVVRNETVEKIIAEWPFKTARVVWNDDFATKKDEKPLTIAESKAKWLRLFAIAEQFCSNPSLQNEIFDRVDEMTHAELAEQTNNPKFEEKLQNCRQSVRLCLTRLCFVTKMIFTIGSRTTATETSTCDFNQLLEKYSIAIPKASNFKGRGPIFATCFMQHLNSVVFDGTDVVLKNIDYQQELGGEEEEEE